MIIYNVTIKLDKQIEAQWLQWMKTEHIPELMSTGLFTDNRLCQLLEQDDEEGVTYVAQYFCESRTHYERYISEHAQQMREKGLERFGNKFIAFRTVMEVVGGVNDLSDEGDDDRMDFTKNP